MSKTYVLVELDDLRLGDYFYAPSRELLAQRIKSFYAQRAGDSPTGSGDFKYYGDVLHVVLAMLARAPDTEGVHTLKADSPCWQPWVLFVVEAA
jgi:hypothetical protein